jgi:hypothetical protein
MSVTTSQTPFLAELAAGHAGPPIPMAKRAYFQQRLRIRVFNFLLEKFVHAQSDGLNKSILAKRIGKTPDVVNRWLGAPSNLTIDTISDLLLGIAAEELELDSSSPLEQVAGNYSHFDEMVSTKNAPLDQVKSTESPPASALSTSHIVPKQFLNMWNREENNFTVISSAEAAAYGPARAKAANE